MQKFLEEISCTLLNGAKYEIEKTKTGLNVNITEGNLGFLIGYRGETLYAFQNILTAVAGKNIENRVRVIFSISSFFLGKNILFKISKQFSPLILIIPIPPIPRSRRY